MASAPQGNVIGVGSTVTSGYPVFGSQDGSGNIVTPYGAYVWNGASWQLRSLASLVSTTSTLLANAPFTSSTIDASAYAKITGTIYASHPGTLLIQQSFDGTNWDAQFQLAYDPSTSAGTIEVPVLAPNLRVVYTNGGVAQTAFRLYIGGRPI